MRDIGYLYFLASVLLTLVCLVVLAVQAARRRGQALRRVVVVLVGWWAVYACVLLGVGLSSRPTQMRPGDLKCYDEWCATVSGVHGQSEKSVVLVRVENHGRRAQRPDTPQLFVKRGDRWEEVEAPGLRDRVPGKSSAELHISVDGSVQDVLVTEGGGPAPWVVGEEKSPFHAKAYWHVGD
ncbi:MAG: hypothetical protein JSS65_02550 [Armatimonadetes bacterium]|nr:hypothetical protein [Armatimonadota bacterium]